MEAASADWLAAAEGPEVAVDWVRAGPGVELAVVAEVELVAVLTLVVTLLLLWTDWVYLLQTEALRTD